MRRSFWLVSWCALSSLGCDETSMPSGGATCSSCEFESSGPPPGSPVDRHGQLSVVGTELVDQNGEAVQLKGVSSMWLNWETSGYAESMTGLEWLRDNWNLSLIRAAMGVAESNGYLSNPVGAKQKVHNIVQNAIRAGVYVIIDWHDHEAQNHTAQARAFFTEMAEAYAEYPNVIYEPFNEPLDVEWSATLKPYHEALVETIRAVDADNPIVLGTPQWSQLVEEAAADPLEGENLLYTLHFYSCTHQQWLRDKALEALDRSLPLFVTEWGATTADGGIESKVPCEGDAQLWHDLLNERKISWAAWKLDDCVDASCLFRQGAPLAGPFDDYLNGHGPFVRDRMLE